MMRTTRVAQFSSTLPHQACRRMFDSIRFNLHQAEELGVPLVESSLEPMALQYSSRDSATRPTYDLCKEICELMIKIIRSRVIPFSSRRHDLIIFLRI
ncbi:hypothetical protein AVEN_13595-1 [Araneus ventricosus]|uniref:Uncharacterized protein n=1 Tax=Araneus ventricosus TaxID=182803 RepID=A0A4Y2D3T9_ARAVE|nr:hypothetical protein AVEN_13595-1 [Araneus ventricosus]